MTSLLHQYTVQSFLVPVMVEAKRGYDDMTLYEQEGPLLWRNCSDVLLSGGQAVVNKVQAILRDQNCFMCTNAGFEELKTQFEHVTKHDGDCRTMDQTTIYKHCLSLVEEARQRTYTMAPDNLEDFRARCYHCFRDLVAWFLQQGRGLFDACFRFPIHVVKLPRQNLVPCPLQQEHFLSMQTSLSVTGTISVYQVRAYLYLLVAELIKGPEHASSSKQQHKAEDDEDDVVGWAKCIVLGCVKPDFQGTVYDQRPTKALTGIVNAEMFDGAEPNDTWSSSSYHMNAALHKLLLYNWRQVGDMVYKRCDYLRFQREVTNADGIYKIQYLILPLGAFDGLMPRDQWEKGIKPTYVNAHRQIGLSWKLLNWIVSKPDFRFEQWNVKKWLYYKSAAGIQPRYNLVMTELQHPALLPSFIDLLELMKEFLLG